jgi:hypothetical protein
MDRRAGKILIAIALVAVAGSPLLAVPVDAGTQCKSETISGNGWSVDQANSQWSATVRSKYGSAWSNFNLARNKRYTYQSFIFETLTSVIATPCRKT